MKNQQICKNISKHCLFKSRPVHKRDLPSPSKIFPFLLKNWTHCGNFLGLSSNFSWNKCCLSGCIYSSSYVQTPRFTSTTLFFSCCGEFCTKFSDLISYDSLSRRCFGWSFAWFERAIIFIKFVSSTLSPISGWNNYFSCPGSECRISTSFCTWRPVKFT